MRDSQKTRKQLISELQESRRQLEILAAAEVERKKADHELNQSEEKFYKAFLSSPDMIIISSIKDGKYIEVNDSFVRNTGYSRDELIGHTVDDFKLFVNPEEQVSMMRILQETGGLKNKEYHFRIRSGEIRTWLCSAEIISIDNDPCMIAVATDVTELRKVEQALRESENKLAVAFRSSPQAISITTIKEGRFIEANDSLSRMTGYTHDELIGNKSVELKMWADDNDRKRVMKTLEKKGRVYNEELQFYAKNGDIQILLFSAEKINIGGEECVISSSTDVTEIKKIEQALRDSEEKFSKAFRSIPEAVSIATLKGGIFLEVNDSFVSIIGYSREETIGHTSKELNFWVNPGDRYRMKQLLEKRGHFENEEFILRNKSHEIRTVLLSADVINLGGRPCMLTVGNDITERKQIEQALQESEEKFAKAFRASPQVISITRLSDGVFKEINESFCRVLGYSREEVIGRSSSELDVWVNRDDRKDMVSHLKKYGRVSNKEFRYRTKSGEIRNMLWSADQIELDGETCVLAVTVDITDYKRMEVKALEVENLKQLDRLRAELLANVSHELRTPLASIKGFATMLIDYDKRLTPAEKREYLETIDKNADRLVELIEQLLEMSRLGVGMLSIKKVPADIITLCQTVISEALVRAPEHIFKSDLPPRLPKINIDSRRIRQVLDNIIDNAVKYSDPGTEISLSVQKIDGELLFTIIDHGTGIPKSDMPQLFQRMFHSPRGQKLGVAGAGLGLSICKGLIESHGGKIWIESEEGVGTRCFFTLPLEIVSERYNAGTSHTKKHTVRS
ncbi:MAG: PAS domain S-box protein [Dehalococcoidales bacterium]|nr:PAS domain S-box protein [Dehalococcoidales bacterium]